MLVEQRVKAVAAIASRKDTAAGGPGEPAAFTPNPKLKLREQMHEVMRFFHYSPRTEETYWHWIGRFLRFCREHPDPHEVKGS